MKKLIKYFGNGLLFLVPAAVTVYVVLWLFNTVGGGVWGLVGTSQDGEIPVWFQILGVIITLVVITLVGLLSSFFITRPFLQLIEKMFGRLPLVKLLYSSIKDLIGAFVGDKKKFDKPVMVNLVPGSNIKALGFITRQSLDFLGLTDEVAVYFPQSYNFAGSVMIIPRAQVTPIDVDSSDVMTFIVSGGVTGGVGHQEDAT